LFIRLDLLLYFNSVTDDGCAVFVCVMTLLTLNFQLASCLGGNVHTVIDRRGERMTERERERERESRQHGLYIRVHASPAGLSNFRCVVDQRRNVRTTRAAADGRTDEP